MTLTVKTDENGRFQQTQTYNPPGPFSITVQLEVELLSPTDTVVSGELDIDAVDGSPTNQSKKFLAEPGKRISLGSWTLDSRDNLIVVNGITVPVKANTDLAFEMRASL